MKGSCSSIWIWLSLPKIYMSCPLWPHRETLPVFFLIPVPKNRLLCMHPFIFSIHFSLWNWSTVDHWEGKIKRKFSYSISETFFPVTRSGKKSVDSCKLLYVKNLKICCSWNNFNSPRNCHLDSFLVVAERFVTMTNQYNYASSWILKNIHTL